MSRTAVIITAISLNLLASQSFAQSPAQADAVARPVSFHSYRVRLEIDRNGIFIGAPDSVVAVGEPSGVELPSPGRAMPYRVLQRVTAFPGADGSRALLELELYGQAGARARRWVAPTLGLELGHSQVYELRTEQGLVRIRATVEGLDSLPVDSAGGLQTMAYPGA